MRRLWLAASAGLLLLVIGCSAGAPQPAPAPSSEASSPVVDTPTPTPTPAACPDGNYRITGLEGRGSASSLGKGSGGNVTMGFSAGTFTLASDGSDPIKLDVGPTTVDLRLMGQITGTYAGDPSALTLAVTGATGTATAKGFGVNRELPMQQVADQLLPSGSTAVATCTGETATLELPQALVQLTRA